MAPWSNTDFPYQCLLDCKRTARVSYQMSNGLASLHIKLSEE
jgi:hypothetical protein